MTCIILDGKKISESLQLSLARDAAAFEKRARRKASARFFQVGSRKSSSKYLQKKLSLAGQLGMDVSLAVLSSDIPLEALSEELAHASSDPTCDGVLLQLPLPDHCQGMEFEMLSLIAPYKDIDGLHPANFTRLASGELPGVEPCTPKGVLYLIRHAATEMKMTLTGMKAVVIGRSRLVGQPTALMLQRAGVTVTVCHKQTPKDLLAQECRSADIVVTAAGVPGLLTAGMLKPGAIVIDVGLTYTVTGLQGDVLFDECKEVAGAITPVPGGVGPLTLAMLMSNILVCAEFHEKRMTCQT